jgi:peptide/nickel transport system substrate-binding protein
MAEPPIPLHPYVNVSMSQTILQAVNDGPVDYVHFTYQPVLLEHIPTVGTGEVVVQEVAVQTGDLIFDPQTNAIQEHVGPDITMDQLVVHFPLRRDVAWSDGIPLTAHDSIYAYQLLADSAPDWPTDQQSPAQRLVGQTADYAAVDEFTIKWTGIPGFISTHYPRFFFPPMPRHQETNLVTNWPPVGWGAFTIEEWLPGRSLLMVQNPNYFLADSGLPAVDEVEFRFFEPPYDNLPAEISAEKCHIISRSIAPATRAEAWLAASQISDFHLVSIPGATGWQLLFNVDEDRLTSSFDLRRAVGMCLNRSAVAELFHSTVANSYVHPTDPAYMEITLPDFDPQQGRSFLAESGLVIPSLKLILSNSPDRQLLGEQITADLAECGIAVETEYLVPESLFQPWPEGPLYGGEYDIAVMALNAAEGPACHWFLSDNVPMAERPDGLNAARWQNSEFDQLCSQALVTLEETERIRLHQEAQQIWGEFIPSIPLFWANLYTGIDCRVDGYMIDPSGIELWNLETISLSEDCHP